MLYLATVVLALPMSLHSASSACDYSTTSWTQPASWCTEGYPNWPTGGTGDDASCGRADMLGVLYGNRQPLVTCASRNVKFDGDFPVKGVKPGVVKAESLFPYSDVYNKRGSKSGYLTCANNCPGNSFCKKLSEPGQPFAKVDLDGECPSIQTCYPDRQPGVTTGTPTEADCCAGDADNVGGVAGFPPGRWPSVFHGPHGGSDSCTNDKYGAVGKEGYQSLVQMWNDLLDKYRTTLPDAYDQGDGTFMCLKKPDDGKEIKAVMAKGHGALSGACGDAQLIRSKLDADDGTEVTRYMALLQTAPRTWSLELTAPANLYIGGKTNDGSGGCLIPDAGVPLSSVTGFNPIFDSEKPGKGSMKLRMYNGTTRKCEDVGYTFHGPSPPPTPPQCKEDDGTIIQCSALPDGKPEGEELCLQKAGTQNLCRVKIGGQCPRGTTPCTQIWI